MSIRAYSKSSDRGQLVDHVRTVNWNSLNVKYQQERQYIGFLFGFTLSAVCQMFPLNRKVLKCI